MRVFLAVLVFIAIVAFTLEIAASKPVKQLREASVRSIKTGGNNCGQFNCGTSDRCCSNNFIGPYRNQCYNPSTHHCIPDGFKPSQNCLCGVNDGCCNQVCFDPRHYSCDTSTGRLKQIPSPPPTNNNCGQFQCGSTDLCCSNNSIGPNRNQCYSPNTHHCIPDSFRPQNNCLCGRNDGCCNGVCFDARQFECQSGSIVPRR